jgi:quercetin dioxygenase-like cupin family protein
MSAKVFKWDDIPMENLNDFIGRKIISGEKAMMAQIFLKKGGIVPLHQHENEQITFIPQGKLKFWIGSEDAEPIILGAGEVLLLPGGTFHKAEALEDTLDIDVFAPPREDWLKKTDDYLRK